jgi:hypothetical protein
MEVIGATMLGLGDERLAEVQRQWSAIHKVCRQKGRKVHALLNDATPVRFEMGPPPVLVLQAKYPFHRDMLREPANREVIEWAIEQVLETRVCVRFELAGVSGNGLSAGREASDDGPRAPAARAGNGAVPLEGLNATRAARLPVSQLARADATGPHLPAAPQNGFAANGYQGGGHRMGDSQPSCPIPPASPQDAPPPDDGAALEAEVRADPIVQEILRTCGTDVVEIRLLDSDEAE